MINMHDDLVCRDKKWIWYRINQYQTNNVLPNYEKQRILEILTNNIQQINNLKSLNSDEIFFTLYQCYPRDVIIWKENIILYGWERSRAFIEMNNKIFIWPECEHEALLYYLTKNEAAFKGMNVKRQPTIQYISIKNKIFQIKKNIGILYNKEKKPIPIEWLSVWKIQVNTKSKKIIFVQNGSWLLEWSKLFIQKTAKILKRNFPDYSIYYEGTKLDIT